MTQAADLGAIPNTRRDAYRARVNENLQALASYHAGSSPPPVAYPFLCWADTGTGKFRMRDAANTAWITVGELGPPLRWYSADIAVNVRSWGAVGNGIADDTAAVQAALTAAAGNALYFPPGVYLLTAALTLAGGVTICGAGQGVCELRWSASAASAGISLAAGAAGQMHVVRDLCLTTAGTTGVALSLDYSAQIVAGVTQDRLQPRFLVDAVTIEGASVRDSGDAMTSGWQFGIVATAGLYGTIRDATIHGRAATPFSAVTGTRGILFRGNPETGSNNNGVPAGLVVDNLNMFFFEHGISLRNAFELHVSASNLLACNVGVYLDSQYGHGRATIVDTHLNCFSRGVLATGVTQVKVIDCLIYAIQTSSGFIGVLVDAASTVITLCRNTFQAFSGRAYGIWVEGGYAVLSGNIFDQQGTNMVVAITLAATSHHCNGSDNVFHGSFTATIANSGTANTVS